MRLLRARNREVLEGRGWRDIELVTADALDPATLGPALAGVEVAYYLMHSMAAGRDFAALDRAAADHFAAAAAAASVRHIVYLGGIVPPQPASIHLRSRRETGARLRAGPVPVTEIRAGMIVGPRSAAFEVIRDLVNYLPVMITPRWVRTRSTPIALDNLLEYLIRVVVARIGGRREGYFYGWPLWLVRRALDWLVGGPSLRRGRRDRDRLRVGDAVDAWRVIAVEPGRRLTLLMEMKAPGAGVLELAVRPEGAGSRITATAYFHPAGIWGLLYWYPLVPFHRYLFRGMVRAIARRAEAEAARAPVVSGQAPPTT